MPKNDQRQNSEDKILDASIKQALDAPAEASAKSSSTSQPKSSTTPGPNDIFEGYLVHVKPCDTDVMNLYELYREYIRHQYDLLNHRTTWFIGFNAFLFGTYGLTVQKKFEVVSNHLADFCNITFLFNLFGLESFALILGVFGVYLGMVSFGLLRAAARPIDELAVRFNEIMEIISKTFYSSSRATPSVAVTALPLIIGGLRQANRVSGPKNTLRLAIGIAVTWALISINSLITFYGNRQAVRYLIGWEGPIACPASQPARSGSPAGKAEPVPPSGVQQPAGTPVDTPPDTIDDQKP